MKDTEYNPPDLNELQEFLSAKEEEIYSYVSSSQSKMSAYKEEADLFNHSSSLERSKLKHIVVKWAIMVGAFMLGTTMVLRFWHFLARGYMCWIREGQLIIIDTAIVSGLFGSIVGKFFNQIFDIANAPRQEIIDG
jgi:hypothetical protein